MTRNLFGSQNRAAAQGIGRGKARQQRAKIIAILPWGKGERLEAVFQLIIRTDRQIGFFRTNADGEFAARCRENG